MEDDFDELERIILNHFLDIKSGQIRGIIGGIESSVSLVFT